MFVNCRSGLFGLDLQHCFRFYTLSAPSLLTVFFSSHSDSKKKKQFAALENCEGKLSVGFSSNSSQFLQSFCNLDLMQEAGAYICPILKSPIPHGGMIFDDVLYICIMHIRALFIFQKKMHSCCGQINIYEKKLFGEHYVVLHEKNCVLIKTHCYIENSRYLDRS